MGEYQFTVQILKDRINHFYVVTDSGEQPADDSWKLTGDVEIITEDHY